MITCDFVYLNSNYILLCNGNVITTSFIKSALNNGYTKVTIRNNEISYSNDPFKPIYATVCVNGVPHRNKIEVFDKNNHVEQFQETYDRLFGKEDNLSKVSSNNKINTNKELKLWQKAFLKLIESCIIFMTRLKKQVEK